MKNQILNLISLSSFSKPLILKRNKCFSPSGKVDKPIYKYKYDENYGCPRRVHAGYINMEDLIEESRDSVDFSSLGKMLVDTKANIIDHFVSSDGQVIDISGTPRNIHEATKLMLDLHDNFDKLPVELKALFDNDFDTFRSSYKAGTLGTKIQGYYQSISEPIDESVDKKDGE